MARRIYPSVFFLSAFLLLPAMPADGGIPFIRGDMNFDGSVDISDPISVLYCLFLFDQPCQLCRDALDADDSGEVELTDAIYVLYYLFLAGDPPPPPFPGCGEDPTVGQLTCLSYGACPPGPEGSLTSQSGCKKGFGGGGSSTGEECMEYTFASGVLTLRHVNAGLNCCAKAAAKIAVEDAEISIEESETYEVGPCRCECLFDIDLEVRNLEPGPYVIRVSGPIGKGLEFPVDLEKEPSGSYCEERTGYPWGG